MSTFSESSYGQPSADFHTSVTEMISRIETQMATAQAEEKPAFAAAIESLIRLRDRDSFPVINSAVATIALQKTNWQSAPDAKGFRQTLTFHSKGGQWHTNPLAHPFGFNWLVESNRVRLSYLSPYKDSYNYQIVDRTFTYAVSGDTLTMKRGDEVLIWKRVPK